MAKCIFIMAWCGRCTAEATENQFCDEHKVLTCVVCGKQATKECDYAGQFICGAPLCNDCTYFNDPIKMSGNWGYMNHEHRQKYSVPKFNPGDIVSFCGDEAEVIRDFDSTIRVKQHNDNGGYDYMAWYKVFQGEPVKLVQKAS